MKKKDLIVRLAIMAVMMLTIVTILLVEIGVATLFDMRFEGLTYLQYIRAFYQIPWHFMLGLVIAVVSIIVCGESIYRSIMKIEE